MRLGATAGRHRSGAGGIRWRRRATGKKKLHWHSTFGEIWVVEQSYLGRRDGKLKRPFAQTAQVHCRGYSGPLQRAITDPSTGSGQALVQMSPLVG